jgi:hypothetical protein
MARMTLPKLHDLLARDNARRRPAIYPEAGAPEPAPPKPRGGRIGPAWDSKVLAGRWEKPLRNAYARSALENPTHGRPRRDAGG